MTARGTLEFLSHTGAKEAQLPRTIALTNATVVIGRSRKMVHVVLDLPSNTISRRHAEVICAKGVGNATDAFKIRDLQSTNGVFVNNFRVAEKVLEHNDVVQFGGAAGVPVGTEFAGNGCHIRYRFAQQIPASSSFSCKRRVSGTASKLSSTARPTPQRASKIMKMSNSNGNSTSAGAQRGAAQLTRTNTANAVERLRPFGKNAPRSPSEEVPVVLKNDEGGGTERGGGAFSSMVMEMLGEATCALCSELLLDVAVLACSHCFCRLCWMEHATKNGSTCPICQRKHVSSERGRRCLSFDILIATMTQKLSGEERDRWTRRKDDAKQRAQAQQLVQSPVGVVKAGLLSKTVRDGSTNGRFPDRPAASFSETPLNPSRRIHVASRFEGIRPSCATRTGGKISHSPTERYSSNKVDGEAADKVVARAVMVQCDGCNETGHDLAECPHRSDSALEESGDDEDESNDDEYDDE